MKLSQYAGKQIALIMAVQGNEVVLRGLTSLRYDERQGRMLRIRVNSDQAAGSPVFLISEDQWTRNIVTDDLFGCDFRLDLSYAEAGVSS